MGLNAYLEAVGSYGYTAGSATATNAAKNIAGKPGKRLAILNFAFQETDGVKGAIGYFMKSMEDTTASAAIASGATTITVTTMTNTPATGGHVCVVLDDGTYQFVTVASTATTSSIPISSALTDSVAAGNSIYYLALYNTTGAPHNRWDQATVGTQEAQKSDLGIFFGSSKGSPMRVEISDNSGTQVAELDLVTYGYINV